MRIEQLAVSPCSSPQISLEESLREFSKIGFRKMEVFSEYTEAKIDISTPPQKYIDIFKKYNMSISSMHLPVINNLEEDLNRAIRTAEFAKLIGVKVVIFKAKTKELYISGAKKFLEMTEKLNVTTVLQNHKGTAISTLDDFKDVITGINDKRMKSLLEVGMFHSVGTNWKEAYDFLEKSVALVHIKDQIGETRVPFGKGEVDFYGLFKKLNDDNYNGDIVIEMEVCRENFPKTISLLAEAREFCCKIIENLK